MSVSNGRSPSGTPDWVLFGAAALLPVGAFLLLRSVPGLDVVFRSLSFHLLVVSLVSGCALVVAALAGRAAVRARQPAVVLLAMGCLSLGFLMLAHGLTTPMAAGRPFNLWVARTPLLAIACFAVFSGAAAAGPHGWFGRLVGRRPAASLLLTATVIGGLCTAIVIWPAFGPGSWALPGEELARHALSGTTAAVLLGSMETYRRRWQLGGDRVQLAMGVASLLAAEALLSLEFGELWRLSWWDYHALLLAGFGTAVYAVFAEYRRARTIEGALTAFFLTDPLDHIARGYPETLKALVAAVEAKDIYTHGHSARVAETAVRIGQRMGLKPAALRRLAQGALLHDIGKIGVPDHILNKPGPLTPEEWNWIKQHPIIGEEIVQRAPSLHHAVPAIRHHHERLDGQGYPDQLEGEDIPLEARIVAVADVWDALRSDRAYRPAWPLDRAVDHMVAGRGVHFDPACLDAFLSLLAEEGIRPSGRSGEVSEVLAAARDCHRGADGQEALLRLAQGHQAPLPG